MNNKQPSFLKVTWIDYWAFAATVIAVIAPGVYLYDTLVAGNNNSTLGLVMLVIFVLFLLAIGWRYSSLVSLYNSGLEAAAIISEVGFFRDRGYIRYIYSHAGQKYQGSMRVMKNRFTEDYEVGDDVNVIVDRENPRKSMLGNLFV